MVEADAIGLGYGFLPASELIRLLGCPQVYDAGRDQLVTPRDDDMRAGSGTVFAVGRLLRAGRGARRRSPKGSSPARWRRPTSGRSCRGASRERLRRLGGISADIAGSRRLSGACSTHRPLDLAFADPGTIVCRCEEVTLDSLERALADGVSDMGSLKRATRLGMGRCQGRYCGPLAARLLADRGLAELDALAFFAPRPPIRPVRLGALAGPADASRTDRASAGEPVPPQE